MSESSKSIKQSKREARQTWEEAREAVSRGDYKRARALDRKVTEIAPQSDLAGRAQQEISNLRTDPWVIYAGLGALALYGAAWLVALA